MDENRVVRKNESKKRGMPFEFKEIGARVCQTIFFHTFSPSKTVRLTTTAGVSRVIIIDEGKRGKSSNNTLRSILHASTNDTKNHSNSCPRCIDDNNNNNDNNDNSRRNSSSGIVGENLSNLTVLVRSTISRPS